MRKLRSGTRALRRKGEAIAHGRIKDGGLELKETFQGKADGILRQGNGPSSDSAPGISTAEPHNIVLANGLRTAVQYRIDPRDMMYGTILINAGSDHEAEAGAGAAHFLEHLLYGAEIQQQIESRGGSIDAATWGPDITINIRLPYSPENQTLLLATLKQTVTDPGFSDKVTEKERTRILNERGGMLDIPTNRVRRLGQRLMYEDKPLVGCELGSKESIRALRLEDLKIFMDRYFNAATITAVFQTPRFERTEALADEVRETFRDLKTGSPAEPVTAAYTPYQRRLDADTEQLYFMYGFNIPDADPADVYINAIYRNYLQRLLNRDVVEKGLLYRVGAGGFFAPRRASFLTIIGDILPEQADEIGPAVARIIGATGHTIDPELFATARLDTLYAFKGGEDNWLKEREADNMARELALNGRTSGFWENYQKAAAVTADDLMRFAREKILQDPPSLYAYGDSSRLHGQMQFEALLRQAALPGAPEAGRAGGAPKPTIDAAIAG